MRLNFVIHQNYHVLVVLYNLQRVFLLELRMLYGTDHFHHLLERGIRLTKVVLKLKQCHISMWNELFLKL